MLSDKTWELLFQIPLAGVVVFVVTLFLRSNKEQMTAFMRASEKQISQFVTTQEHQISLFMDAIQSQREQNNAALHELTIAVRGLEAVTNRRFDALERSIRGKKG